MLCHQQAEEERTHDVDPDRGPEQGLGMEATTATLAVAAGPAEAASPSHVFGMAGSVEIAMKTIDIHGRPQTLVFKIGR
jgi:hypothetical protein